jgi:ABC-2 type transport system permease protein
VTDGQLATPRPRPPGEAAMTWLIARRAATESLRDRLSLLVGAFFAFALPLGALVLVVRPLATGPAGQPQPALAATLPFYLLVVGVAPAFSAVGIAAGEFAGEKERGLLTPLLASPASNLAIFGGKVLGAIIPPLGYAAVAEAVYVLGVAALIGPDAVRQLPTPLGAATVLLVPAVAWFAAIVASLISSRVRTFNAAQQLAGLALMPVWGLVFGLAGRLQDRGPVALFGAVVVLLLLDGAATVLAAATWRREEVLAHN